MSDIATKKLFENEKVRVWEMILEPGESTGLHTHKNEYFFHVLEGTVLETFDTDGGSIGGIEFPTGSTHYLTLNGSELNYNGVPVPATHDAKNTGPTRYREILVEFK